jgi:hypothetical protein
MPLEGHWARQNAPLIPSSRRELRVLLVAGILALLATAAVCLALVGAESPNARPGCKRVTVAMTTGGATIEHCGYKTDR